MILGRNKNFEIFDQKSKKSFFRGGVVFRHRNFHSLLFDHKSNASGPRSIRAFLAALERICETTEFSNSRCSSGCMCPIFLFGHSIDAEFNSLSNHTSHMAIGFELTTLRRRMCFSRSKKVEYSSFHPLPL